MWLCQNLGPQLTTTNATARIDQKMQQWDDWERSWTWEGHFSIEKVLLTVLLLLLSYILLQAWDTSENAVEYTVTEPDALREVRKNVDALVSQVAEVRTFGVPLEAQTDLSRYIIARYTLELQQLVMIFSMNPSFLRLQKT